MIEEPPVLTLRRSFPRPSAAQIAAFKGVPTGFVCDAMGGQGALSSDIQPIGGGRDIDCRAIGPALVADNGPAEILATMGALHILEPGDIIATGTPGGVGIGMKPPQLLKSGDSVRIEIEGIGEIENPIIDEPTDTAQIV